jgi:hypothetical protein
MQSLSIIQSEGASAEILTAWCQINRTAQDALECERQVSRKKKSLSEITVPREIFFIRWLLRDLLCHLHPNALPFRIVQCYPKLIYYADSDFNFHKPPIAISQNQ